MITNVSRQLITQKDIKFAVLVRKTDYLLGKEIHSNSTADAILNCLSVPRSLLYVRTPVVLPCCSYSTKKPNIFQCYTVTLHSCLKRQLVCLPLNANGDVLM